MALSLIGLDSLDNDEPLMDAGLDSLAAVEFGNTLAKEFQGAGVYSRPDINIIDTYICSSSKFCQCGGTPPPNGMVSPWKAGPTHSVMLATAS